MQNDHSVVEDKILIVLDLALENISKGNLWRSRKADFEAHTFMTTNINH